MLTHIPGSDIMSKHVTADPQVKDAILKFLGLSGTYTIVDNLFKDGSEADVIMIPQERIKREKPPILIEIQQLVHFSFTARLIGYCTKLMERYMAPPLVIVFNVNGFQSQEYKNKFIKTDNYYTTESAHWAKKMYLFNLKSIEEDLASDSIQDISMLAYFFGKKEVDIRKLEHKANPFLIHIYAIAEEMFGKRENAVREYADTLHFFNNLFSDIKNRTKSPYITSKCSAGETRARKSRLNLLAIEQDDLTDREFVDLFKETDLPMNWSLLFDQGADLGHFSRYNNYQSLRSAYNKGTL